MITRVDKHEPKLVELRTLNAGDGFIDNVGDPYIVFNPNTTNFNISRTNGDRVRVLVISCGYDKPMMGHIPENELVTPADVVVNISERKTV